MANLLSPVMDCTTATHMQLAETTVQSSTSWRPTSMRGGLAATLVKVQMDFIVAVTTMEVVRQT